MAERLSVEFLLASKTEANFLKERNLDSIIHKKYIEQGNNNDKHYNFDIIEHILYDEYLVRFAQQYNRIELRQLFNDPSVYYNAGRFYLNGKTGTMSAILVNCQFMLYNYLLSHDVEIDPNQDIILILHRILSMKTNEEVSELEYVNIQKEKKAIVNILKQIEQKYGVKFGFVTKNKQFIFSIFANKQIYTDIIGYLEESSKIFIQNNITHDFLQRIINDQPYLLTPHSLCTMYMPWEYMPIFIKRFNDNICELLRNQQLLYLLNKFITENDIYRNRPFNINEFINFQKKYLKYKQKYIALKNQIGGITN